MHEPQNVTELGERILKNSRVEGIGMETANHMACPFCGEAEFMRIRVIAAQDDMEKGGHCDQCDRTARAIVDRREGSIAFIMVQTGGPVQPEWMGDQKMPHIHNLDKRWTDLL